MDQWMHVEKECK